MQKLTILLSWVLVSPCCCWILLDWDDPPPQNSEEAPAITADDARTAISTITSIFLEDITLFLIYIHQSNIFNVSNHSSLL
jgi:hypothetical protein